MRAVQLAPLVLLLASAAAWLGAVRGLWSAGVVIAAAGALLLSLVANGWLTLASLRRRSGPVRADVGRLLVYLGLGTALLGGATNWLRGIRGVVVLVEQDAVPLAASAHLVERELGPLASASELEQTLMLNRVELVPMNGRVSPRSKIQLLRGSEVLDTLTLEPGRAAVAGPLVFSQGAFGFSPRLVIVKGDRTLLDQVVMFRTTPGEVGVYSYDGEVEIETEGLRLSGSIDLSTLDDQAKGHPRMAVELKRGDQTLGRGWLRPGHFAEAGEYRVGLTGLDRWSEIDFARRNFREVVLAGLSCTLLGAVLWLVWRKR